MFNSKLKIKIKELEDEVKFLKKLNNKLMNSLKESTSAMGDTAGYIEKTTRITNKSYSMMERNCAILSEMVYEADDTLNELFKITSTYHPMIIRGVATKNDIQTCSNIVQKSLVSYQRFDKLKILYNKIYNKPVTDLDIGKTKK